MLSMEAAPNIYDLDYLVGLASELNIQLNTQKLSSDKYLIYLNI